MFGSVQCGVSRFNTPRSSMQVNRRGCCSIYPRLVPFKRIRTPAPCNHRTIKTGQDILFRFSLCIPFCFVVFCLNHQQTQNKRQYYRCPCLFPKWLSHLPLSQLPSPTRSAKNKGVGPRSLCARYPRRCPGEGALPLRGVPRVEVRERHRQANGQTERDPVDCLPDSVRPDGAKVAYQTSLPCFCCLGFCPLGVRPRTCRADCAAPQRPVSPPYSARP